MPGTVISINVGSGEYIQRGQELCTIEAMKMQNIIRASRSGVLETVGLKVGDRVSVNQVLMEFVKADTSDL